MCVCVSSQYFAAVSAFFSLFRLANVRLLCGCESCLPAVCLTFLRCCLFMMFNMALIETI